jgi:hypothetical protein
VAVGVARAGTVMAIDAPASLQAATLDLRQDRNP